MCNFFFFFFFQAEDGIRDPLVTGVQRVLFRSSVRENSKEGNAPSTRSSVLASPFPHAANVTNKADMHRSEEHTSELQSRVDLVCRLLLEKKKKKKKKNK